ncbi:MAG: bifunctional RNase H/acid phosphatase [Candidatus Phosphoribacter baldrii]|nr:bifunctional RNase H/acid phosphatase [Dermatophilaceae bacterium]
MPRRLIVEADGGSRGNPGVAGFGALVRDAATGAVLLERAEPLGLASNNVAEYAGLLAGLEGALRLDPAPDVEVRMDSKLVVEQMSGRWKIKHEDMKRLAGECQNVVRRILAGGGRVRYTWIPREQNKAADALSNHAMDGKSIDREPDARDLTARPVEATDRQVIARMDSGTSASLVGEARIILIRHGVTDFTVSGRLDGRGGANPELNAEGVRQADAVARIIPDLVGDQPARVITSSLRRTQMTGAAVAAALGVTPELQPDWDERSFGEWDGLTLAQIHERHPAKLARMRMDAAYPPPGGESRVAVAERVTRAFEEIATAPGTVVVVTSRVPILVVLSQSLQIPAERFWALQTEPASVSIVCRWPDGNVSVPLVNRTDHLR